MKIPKPTAARHLVPLAVLALALLCLSVGAQQRRSLVQLSAQDVADVITYYRSPDPKRTVEALRRQMPTPVRDPAFRLSVHRSLPALAQPHIDDPELTAAVQAVLDPALSLYDRSAAYDIIVIRSPIPLMASYSGVVLIISTGLIEQAASDDELLGYAAHEVGHEYLRPYAIATKSLYNVINDGGAEAALARKVSEVLAVMELECDAFASITLAALGRSPLAFIWGIERMARQYADRAAAGHPEIAARRAVVSGVIPASALNHTPRVSAELQRLKELVARK